jgi:hypothetical protein
MNQSIQVRLVTVAMQWQVVLTSFRLFGVFVGTLLAGANCIDHYQVLSGACTTTASSCEVPALIERLKAIEFDRVLIVVGEALIPFDTQR